MSPGLSDNAGGGAAVIRVENLSKRYRIGGSSGGAGYAGGNGQAGYASYGSLRESLSNAARAPLRRLRGEPAPQPNEIWALKDVSFEVHQGETLGIIGRNGAGKSTLLKILSRITRPTHGRVTLRGRVGSLLEVGTGFHPELTGRENIFLNGAILGMRRTEIERKFDQMVDFAEIEQFLDTPVKHYSSGMYMRLAFAVAAHLEPEILLVDEVLAVGDAQFQKKCLGKMGQVAKEGRTVLFVSHNMAAVDNLCQIGIVLNRGGIHFLGGKTEAISHYLNSLSGNTHSLSNRVDRLGSGEIRVVKIEVRDLGGNVLDLISSGQAVDIYLFYEQMLGLDAEHVLAGISVKTQMDVPVFLQHNRLTRDEFISLPERGAFVCRIERVPLPPGSYRLGYSIMYNNGLSGEYFDSLPDAALFTVIEGDFFGSGEVPPLSHGLCLVQASWRLE